MIIIDNLYLTGKELTWKEFAKYYIVAILIACIFIPLKKFNVIQLDAENMYNIVFGIIYVLIIIQMISPRLNRCIINELSFRTGSINAIIIPIAAAIGTRLLTNILQVLPNIFGGNTIGIAKGQLNMSSYSPLDKMFVGTLLIPCLEELLFRVVFFTSIAYILGFIDTKLNSKISVKVFNLNSILCWTLIIINNVLFSASHLPDFSNFHLYFIAGIVNAVIYIKYGFYGSWISHGLYNFIHLNFIFRWLS